jgi:hypothetical protein
MLSKTTNTVASFPEPTGGYEENKYGNIQTDQAKKLIANNELNVAIIKATKRRKTDEFGNVTISTDAIPQIFIADLSVIDLIDEINLDYSPPPVLIEEPTIHYCMMNGTAKFCVNCTNCVGANPVLVEPATAHN